MSKWIKKCGVTLLAALVTVSTMPAAAATHHHKVVRAVANRELEQVKQQAAAAEARAAATALQLQQVQETLEKQGAVLAQLQAELKAQQQVTSQAQEATAKLPAQEEKIEAVQNQVQALSTAVSTDVVPRISELQSNTEKSVSALTTLVKHVTIGGDFRLRFDGITRSALNVPGGSGSVENLRGRYRARLNLGFVVAPTFDVKLQLASGPVNNEVTDNQDFGAFAVKNPISINQAFAHWKPSKYFELNGGRIPEIFGEGSQFVFDPDLNFNGLSQVVHLDSLLPGGKVTFTGGQYILTNFNTQRTNPATTLRLKSAAIFGSGLRVDSPSVNNFTLYGEARQFGIRQPNQIASALAAGTGVAPIFGPIGFAIGGLPGAGNRIIANPNVGLRGVQPYVYVGGFNTGEATLGLEHKDSTHALGGYGAELRAAHNFASAGNKDNALFARFFLGSVANPGDLKLTYTFKYAEADSMLSAFTDDDLGTFQNTNIKAHVFGADWRVMKNVNIQNFLFIETPINNATTFNGIPLFKPVPLQARTYRLHSQILFSF